VADQIRTRDGWNEKNGLAIIAPMKNIGGKGPPSC
jgi:hypothetical protein